MAIITMHTSQLPPLCAVHRSFPAGEPVDLVKAITRELETNWVSPSLLEEIKDDPGFIMAGKPRKLVFDEGVLL